MTCTKVAYPTEASARRSLRAVQEKGRAHKERRAYLCGDCHRYHLTSQDNEDRTDRLKRIELQRKLYEAIT